MELWRDRLFVLVITLGIPVVLILSNVFLVMTPEWLRFQYGLAGFPKAERFADAERYSNGAESIEYVRGNRTLAQFRALGVYEEREIKHMVDVHDLVAQARRVNVSAIILIVVALIGLARLPASRATAARALFNGALLTLAFFVAVGAFAAVGFNTFFTMFHRVFFEGDTWLFNYTDSLIQFYPLPFWFNTSITLVGATIVEAVVVGAIGWWWSSRQSSVVSQQ